MNSNLSQHSTGASNRLGFRRFLTHVVLAGGILATSLAVGQSDRSGPRRALAEARSFLPTSFAESVIEESSIGRHRDETVLTADYVRLRGSQRFLLHEDSYYENGEFIAFGRQPGDSVASFFEAATRAHLESLLENPETRRLLAERSESLYPDIPRERRLEVHIDALSQMSGHIFSIAAAVERSHHSIGAHLCRRLHMPLFHMWDSAFDDLPYRGAYYVRTGVSQGEWAQTRVNLPTEDRQWFLSVVLHDFWSGDSQVDFGHRYCSIG